MGEQQNLEPKNEGSGWVQDPEPEPENPKSFVNIKWDKTGITVEGIYRKKKNDDTFDSTTFLLDDKNGEIIYSVPGTTDLIRKMKDKQPGDILKIEYTHDEDIGKPSPLKKFKIYSWK